MGRWSDLGLLEKAACISAFGAAAGVTLAVIIGGLNNSGAVTGIVLILWFAPAFAWALCAFAVAARAAFGPTAGVSTLIMVLGALTQADGAKVLLFVFIGVPLLTAAAAVFAEPAQSLLSLGREERDA